MKLYSLKYSVLLLFLVVVMVFVSGCEDKDYYDPTFQTENPIGEGVTAPDGFDWKTTRSIPVTIAVNDEMQGEYNYQVEIFKENPLGNPNAGLLTRGMAKYDRNFAGVITVTPDVKMVYIKQTDPRGRIRVKTVATDKAINCVFSPDFIEVGNTRAAIATRAEVEIPDYSVEHPDYIAATEWDGNGFNANTNYKVSAGSTLAQDNKSTIGGAVNVKLFIAGNWTVGNTVTMSSGVELILLEGSNVTFDEVTSSDAEGNTYIMPGATMNIVGDKGGMLGSSSSFYCWGTINVPNGTLDAQNGDGSLFYIGAEGVIDALEMKIHNDKTTIENHGRISVDRWVTGGGAGTIGNYCLIQATESVNISDIGTLQMSGGILIAPQVTIKATAINMENGSMIKCDNLRTEGTTTITGAATGNRSLVKAVEITRQGSGAITLTGHVTLENNNIPNYVTVTGNADMTTYDGSSVVIEGCQSEGNEGDPGEDPEDPDDPGILDGNQYTYMFEDNWPLYGDYDMNDVVFRTSAINMEQNGAGNVTEISFLISYLATGANKRIAGALMLDAVALLNVRSVTYSDGPAPNAFVKFPSGVEQGQRQAVIPLFNEYHARLGYPEAWNINTIPEEFHYDPIDVTVTISFVDPVSVADLDMEKRNFFIITDIDKPSSSLGSFTRNEIHLVGYQPTSKASKAMFGAHNDNSKDGNYYISKDNLAWGVVVPTGAFNWMIEANNIQDGYLDFVPWLQSGGTTNQNWWDDGSIESSKLYIP